MPNKDTQGKRAGEMFPVIERFHSSQLTQKSFCEAEGLALSTLQYWISRYKKRYLQEAHRPQQDAASSPEGFVELKPQLQAPISECQSDTLVISYPNGVTLSLSTGVNLRLLKELINL